MKLFSFSRRSAFAWVLLAALAPWSSLQAADVIDSSSPQKLIETSSKALLADLDANRAKYRKEISGLYKVIDQVFLPHVNVNFSAQQVLGKYWRTATPDQRKRFVDAFYRSLLTTYGDALLDFTGDRMQVKPFQGDPASPCASVRTVIKRSNGADVKVDYSLRRDGTDSQCKVQAGEWKVWDVVIEGISYVKSFREQFALEIDQKGLDTLLKRLESGQLAVKQP